MGYLTPDRFRVMGYGVDLGDLEDADFRFLIERASSLVDAYCAAPMIPSKHDFRGGSITREQHRWRLPDITMSTSMDMGTRRVYPYHTPLKQITSFKVMFTENYSITIDPANLYENQSEGWAEVISLAAIVTGIYPVGVNFGLYTPVAEINYTYGYSFTETLEDLVPTDGFVFRAANQFWAATPAPLVYVNDTLQTSGYTIDYKEGTVIFDHLLQADDEVDATYAYTLPSAIRDATAYIVADILGDRELHQRGMGHVGQVRIAELEIRRQDSFGRGLALAQNSIPVEAMALLDPYRFMMAR